MGLRINTNVASLTAQRHLRATTLRLEKNFQRLATGRRIVTAADDPAGWAMSAALTKEIKSLEKAKRNTQDGISLAEIADGGLESIADVLARARELAVESANGTLAPADKNALQAEFAQLRDQIDQIARSTAMDSLILLDGSRPGITLQIGSGVFPGIDTFGVSLTSALSSALGLTSLDVGATGNPAAALTALDAAIGKISSSRAQCGANLNTLNGTIASLDVRIENLAAANSRILDVDLAAETADLAKNQILQQAGIAVLAQANAQPSIALRLLQNLL